MSFKIFVQRSIIIISLIVATLLLAFGIDFFFMLFASVVLAVLLISITVKIKKWLTIKYAGALAITVLLITIVITGIGLLMYPSLDEQVSQLQKDIPQSISKLQENLSHTSWGKDLLKNIKNPKELVKDNKEDIVNSTTAIFSTTLSSLANTFVVIVIALFFAVDPKLYKKGFLCLLPDKVVPKADKLIYKCYETLANWLKGKFLSMLVVGILTYIGLILLDFPIPLVLSLIAMILTFIPNIGPIIAMIPAMLIGMVNGPEQALYAAALYIIVQTLESYLITPYINKKAVDLPPALTLAWQVFLGIFLGGLGLFMATPLLAVIFVLVNDLYVKGYLKKENSCAL
ncbi:Predicted PurR-regulated permease PerM [Chryseobacterium taeanense]|uniref:Predicted PurR-regulated permease PerM n=1 Tax=Chryseobacterium taeanense TaxID=311334 RepID=A0A1G8FJV1_9FLAO|nr:AI-2E family transporter [Chryseobacterium taeanense]SDH82410.1 Predicted PurR-regulated permease PerM [Chryseobacterium taeanense]